MSKMRQRVARAIVLSTALLGCALDAAAVTATAGQIIISEFRVRGPNGANDEYIVLYNASGANHTVDALSGTGYGVAASNGTTRCSIPNGTVLPNRGTYLCVNSVGYSLAAYPAGNGTTATGDATYTTDIPDNAGIAIFNNNSGGGAYSLANRLDAVGSTSEANVLYKEGTGYAALTPFSIDYTFHRDLCGKGGSITTFGACPNFGLPKDTNNNAADFVFEDTNGTSAGAGQRLGAPGPRNLSSPIGGGGGSFTVNPLDSCVAGESPPNQVRDFTSNPANNSTFGTIDRRFTIVNNTGGNVTRLRFRIVDLTTFPAPGGIADLRPRTSTAVVVTVDRPPCGSGTSNVTVNGTTLEQPPSQPNGGGFNSTLSAGTVTLATPIANGASIDVRFLLGIQQTGLYKLGFVIESLPGGSQTFYVEGCTDTCVPPAVTSITRSASNPTNAATVTYAVTFNQSVTGVNAADFALTTSGVSGASITNVSGSGASYTVTVNTGTGSGTIRLDVVDDDTIMGFGPLGGAGAGNGDFTTGDVYTVDKASPTVTINQGAAQVDPAAASPIVFDVVFSEPVTGFTAADISFTGSTAGGALTANVLGSGANYTVSVSGMTTNGTVVASIPAAAAIDATSNASLVSTSADNTVTWSGDLPPTVTINQAVGQADPTATSPINFTIVFSKVVNNLDDADILFTGSTAGGTLAASVTGGPTTYNVAVSGMTTNGNVVASIPAGAAVDLSLQPSAASTSTDNTVAWTGDNAAPTVTINQAVGQGDPTGTSPINFTVVFSEAVTGFTAADVSFTGSTAAGTLVANVTGGPATYTVAVSGMTSNGTVVASIPAGAAQDGAANASLASNSADNSVSFNGVGSKTFSAPSATGSGTITATFTGGGTGCGFTSSQFIAAPPGSGAVPPTVPPGSFFFPHGLFAFTIDGCTPGSTLSFTVTYPSDLPAGTQYWKYGPEAGNTTPHWYVLPASITGNVATFTIADGGQGDDDLSANGAIVDQGGPGTPISGMAHQTPTLSEWALIVLALLLLAFSAPTLRRRLG